MWIPALITAVLVTLVSIVRNADSADYHPRTQTGTIILKNQRDGSRIGTIEEDRNETVIRDRNGNVMGRAPNFTNAPGDYTIWDNHGNPMGFIHRESTPSHHKRK